MTALDWLPTLTAALGIAPKPGKKLDGYNMWPALKSGETIARGPTPIGMRDSYSVFHDGWKYVEHRGARRERSAALPFPHPRRPCGEEQSHRQAPRRSPGNGRAVARHAPSADRRARRAAAGFGRPRSRPRRRARKAGAKSPISPGSNAQNATERSTPAGSPSRR